MFSELPRPGVRILENVKSIGFPPGMMYDGKVETAGNA